MPKNYPRQTVAVASEYQECRTFWDWIQTQAHIRDYAFHIANEGKRTPRYGHLLKLIGLRAGLPDYVIVKKNALYGSLWLEVKRKSKSVTSLAQNNCIALLRNSGHYAAIVYGADEAIAITKRYFENDPALC